LAHSQVLSCDSFVGLHCWDSGGYTGGNADDPVFQQLLIRWFQFGAFCPLFRLHGEPAALSSTTTTTTQPSLAMGFALDMLTGLTVLAGCTGDRSPELIDECGRTGSPNEIWHYGPQAYESIVKVMTLRESIRPYVKQVMAEANRTGVPALRPL
jgi:alpha-D-xyloside xylohydrolase